MTPREHADELVETFELLDDWEERYSYLIELARKLPPFPPEEKTEENFVHGCQSRVWVTARADESQHIQFNADSDGQISKGLLAMLWRIYNDQPARAIVEFDVQPTLARIGLDQHLSPGRRNGLYGMLTRIKTLAAQQK